MDALDDDTEDWTDSMEQTLSTTTNVGSQSESLDDSTSTTSSGDLSSSFSRTFIARECAFFLGRSLAEAWVAREHHQQEEKGVVKTRRPKEFNTTEEEEESSTFDSPPPTVSDFPYMMSTPSPREGQRMDITSAPPLAVYTGYIYTLILYVVSCNRKLVSNRFMYFSCTTYVHEQMTIAI
jgi:hypothetical protein